MPSIETQVFYTFLSGIVLLTVLFLIIFFSVLHHLREKRRELKVKSFEAECSIEAERKRIASDLHDDFGSLLAGLNLSLRELGQDASSTGKYVQASEQLAVSMERLKEISLNLLPRELEAEGLNAAVEALVERINGRSGIDVRFSSIGEVAKFNSQKAMLFFRIIQEITTNAIKHSYSNLLLIAIAKVERKIIVDIKDTGCGFNYDQAFNKKQSLGLKNIQSRVELLNAVYTVESIINEGTHYYIKIPYLQLLDGK